MKKVLAAAILICTISMSFGQSNKSFGLDVYPLPMLFGEIGGQMEFPMGKSALGVHMTYYNPSVGLTGVIINSQLGPGDELDLNVHGLLPGFSYTHYSKGDLAGFYIGGLFRYKMAAGDVLFKDKYSGGTAYRGIVESEISIHSINLKCISGYRWVFDNNFSLRLGAGLGFQGTIQNEVTYNILEEYDGEGYQVVDDLKEAIDQNTNSFVKPVTFQLFIGIGFTK